MTPAAKPGGRPVVAVTGGGAGIGAAVAEELGRTGSFVVTMDPLVSLDGSARLPEPEETTAGRIIAAGGAAQASAVSVTDGDAIRRLFVDLVAEHGRLDAVINVAGISRPTSFTKGTDEDWLELLGVHLDGYRNVLTAALPIMAAAGRGRILGVTSGSGWRAADTGAYGCAKRAVASLTWQLGRQAPPGVIVNALSPIAVTRMVTAALERAQPKQTGRAGSSTTGGLSLGSMPAPEELGPMAAHLVDKAFGAFTGRVIFAGGSEMAVVEEPRLLEVVSTSGVTSLPHLFEAATAGAFVPAEAAQASTGGSNPRFGSAFHESPGEGVAPSPVRSCVVVSDRPELAAAVTAALNGRGVASGVVDTRATGFDAASTALDATAESDGPPDAVVVALADRSTRAEGESGWERTLAEHADIAAKIHADAGWARAVADHSARADRPVRLVTLTDAVTAGGRSRAQAAAQLARSASGATDGRVSFFPVSVETDTDEALGPVAEFAVHLISGADTPSLSGAEFVAGDGWIGLRSHPRPTASISFGGGGVPDWLDEVLRSGLDPSAPPEGRR